MNGQGGRRLIVRQPGGMFGSHARPDVRVEVIRTWLGHKYPPRTCTHAALSRKGEPPTPPDRDCFRCQRLLHCYHSTHGIGLPHAAPELRGTRKAHLPSMASILDLQLDFDTPGEKLKWLLVIQLGLSAFLSDSAAAVAAVGLVSVLWPHRELLSIFLVSGDWWVCGGSRHTQHPPSTPHRRKV